MLKKGLAILLTLMLAATTMPASVFGQVTVTKGSSYEQQLKEWKIAPTISAATAALNAIAITDADDLVKAPSYSTANWQKAVVPGTVLGNLIDDGVYDDVFTAGNNDRTKDVFFSDNMSKIPVADFANPWWYSTDFSIPAAESGKRVTITLKGVSYTGEIYVNGTKLSNRNINVTNEDFLKNGPTLLEPNAPVADITNAAPNGSSLYGLTDFNSYKTQFLGTMRTYDVDVTDYVTVGSGVNNIKIKVKKPTYSTDLTYYWVDWNPQPADTMMGLTGEVFISTSGTVRMANPAVASKVAPDLNSAALSLYLDVSNTSAAPVNGTLTAIIKDPAGVAVAQLAKTNITVPASAYNYEIALKAADYPELTFTDPQLWWPYLSGGQPLYTVDYEFLAGGSVSDRLHHRFGVREIGVEVNVSPYANQNAASISNSSLANMMQVYVNHKPILLKGGGYCASDLFLRHSQKTNEAVVDYVKYMGMNMIRDEGKFFDNDLLDLLDENGILLMTGWCCCDRWQSPGAWSKAERFVAYESLYSQLRNARSHPSMFMWFNGSDDPPSLSSTGDNGKIVEQRYFEIEANLRWLEIGGVSTSGSARVATLTNITSGMHMDSTYDSQTPTWYYYDRQGNYGFISEGGGGGSVPVVESLRRMLPEGNLWPFNVSENYNIWNYHNTRGSFSNLGQHAVFIDGSYGASNNIDEFVMRAQVYQYDIQRAQYEALNVNRFKETSGFINWMLNNAWPLTFWNQFDYYMNPNGTTYGARKGNEPVHIMYDMYHKSVSVVNNTLDAYPGAKATMTIYDINGKVISKPMETTVDVSSDGASQAVAYPTTGDNRFGPQTVGLVKNDAGVNEPYKVNYYGKITDAYGVSSLWNYDDIQASLIRPTSDVYFIKLELKDAEGKLLSLNSYAEPMRNDVAGASHSWSRSGTFQVPDMTQLNQLPVVDLQVTQTGRRAENGKIIQTIRVVNPTDSIAYAVELKAYTDNSKKTLVAPTIYEDNLFTLFPGESRDVAVTHNASDLAGDAVISVTCYNNVIKGKDPRSAANIYKAIAIGGSNNLAKARTVTGGTNPANATAVIAAGQTAANNGKTFIDSNINTAATMTTANGPFVVDLGSVQAFDRLMLRWNSTNNLRGRPNHIKIEVGDTTSAYRTIVEDYDNTGSGSVMTNIVLPEQVSGRYVRITPTGLLGVSPAVGSVAGLTSSGASQAAAASVFNLSAVEIYAFNKAVFFEIQGKGTVTAGAKIITSSNNANERVVTVGADKTLSFKCSATEAGIAVRVFRDGKDISASLSADNTVTLSDVTADTDIKVMFARSAAGVGAFWVDFQDSSAYVFSYANAIKGYAIAAIYKDNGVLVSMDVKAIDVSGGGSSVIDLGDLSKYQKEGYGCKVFLWNEAYVPLVEAFVQ